MKHKELVDEIVFSIKNFPHNWMASKYELQHCKTDVCIWIANKVFGVDIRKNSIALIPREDLGYFARRKLFKAYEAWANESAEKKAQKVREEILGIGVSDRIQTIFEEIRSGTI